MPRVALYIRVSTTDRDQKPETQEIALQDFCRAIGHEVVAVYIDQASAKDLRGRVNWRRLLQDAHKRRFEVVAVFRLDRAFRSTKHMFDTLQEWEVLDVAFVSAREDLKTTTAMGRFMMTLLAALAELELETIRERVNAGIEAARRKGKRLGRPGVVLPPGAAEILRQVDAGCLSQSAAAKRLGVGRGTVQRQLAGMAERVPKNGVSKTVSADSVGETLAEGRP